jgi:tetratricopeptide (TPR) repeat protein
MTGLAVVALLTGCSSAPPPPPMPVVARQANLAADTAAKLDEQENWQAAAREWQRAVDRYRLLNDRANEAVALHNLAQTRRELGDLAQARALLEQAAALNIEIKNTNEWWRSQIALLQVEMRLNADVLKERFAKLAAAPPPKTRPELRGLFLNEQGVWQQGRGELDKAAESFRAAEQAFQKAKDKAGVAAVLANRALLDEARKDFAAALEEWRRALAAFEPLGDTRGIAAALAGHGRALLAESKDLAAAEKWLRRACENYRTLKAKSDLIATLEQFEQCLVAQGKHDEAKLARTERAALTKR